MKIAIKAAKQAGKIMIKHQNSFKSKKKGINDIVTNVDFLCERTIINTIKKNFPNHKILSEEENNKTKKVDNLWIIDPLDGTFNYARTTAPRVGS